MREQSVFLKSMASGLLLMLSAITFAEKSQPLDEGIQAFHDGRYPQAEAYFQAVVEQSASAVEPLIYLSRIALATGKLDKAEKYIEQVMEDAPENTEAAILAADVYCQKAQNSSIFKALKIARQCIAQYETAIDMDGNNVEALVAATRFHLHAPSVAGGSDKKGRELLARLASVSPEHGDAVRVDWREKEGEREAALTIADQLAGKGFEYPQNQYEIARYYKHVKDYAKARALFDDLSEREPTPESQWVITDSLLQLGEIHLAEGKDIPRSIALIEAYKEANSNPHDVHYFWSTWSLARAHKAAGQEAQYRALVKEIKAQDYGRDKAFAEVFEDAL